MVPWGLYELYNLRYKIHISHPFPSQDRLLSNVLSYHENNQSSLSTEPQDSRVKGAPTPPWPLTPIIHQAPWIPREQHFYHPDAILTQALISGTQRQSSC